MKKENESNAIAIYAQYDMNIPAHKKAMENLEEYRRQTGLSLKDALLFILLAVDQNQETMDIKIPSVGGTKEIEKQTAAEFENLEIINFFDGYPEPDME